MKTLIICISANHGNTEKIAKAMAGVFDAKVLKPQEVDVKSLSQYDLIGFGSGIFYFKHHRALLELADKLPTIKKKAFIFSTGGSGYIEYHKALKDKILKKGFSIVGEFVCKGFDTWGPYKLIGGRNKGRQNKKDLEDARNFAKGLMKVKL
ncbi:Flavodoxin domain protein [uncultured archaeon]|nr:Flavodoxin domain protein [uncultured archaeon]